LTWPETFRHAYTYSNTHSDAELYAHGNAEANANRETKGYAQAEVNTCSSTVSGM
jgi:hypothetical protein